jgi:hypothetical protein
MPEGCGVASKMLAATRVEDADGMKYPRQRLARVFSTSEGAAGVGNAPCREMQRIMISSGVVTTSTRTPTNTSLRPAR